MSDDENIKIIGEGKKRKRYVKRPLRIFKNKRGRYIKRKGRKTYIKSKKSNAALIKKILKRGVVATPKIQEVASATNSEIQKLKSLQDEQFKELVLKNKKDDMESIKKKLEEIDNVKNKIETINTNISNAGNQLALLQSAPNPASKQIKQLTKFLAEEGIRLQTQLLIMNQKNLDLELKLDEQSSKVENLVTSALQKQEKLKEEEQTKIKREMEEKRLKGIDQARKSIQLQSILPNLKDDERERKKEEEEKLKEEAEQIKIKQQLEESKKRKKIEEQEKREKEKILLEEKKKKEIEEKRKKLEEETEKEIEERRKSISKIIPTTEKIKIPVKSPSKVFLTSPLKSFSKFQKETKEGSKKNPDREAKKGISYSKTESSVLDPFIAQVEKYAKKTNANLTKLEINKAARKLYDQYQQKLKEEQIKDIKENESPILEKELENSEFEGRPDLLKIRDLEREILGEGRETDLGKDALYNFEIEKILRPYKHHGFQGAISADQIGDLVPKEKMSFIMNKSPSYAPGSHWIAVNIDSKGDKSIEYFDPLADEPDKRFFKDVKHLVDKLKPETYLKMKINRIKEQDEKSSTCGFHCVKFLLNRWNGIPFKEATPYTDVRRNEKKAQKMARKFKKFGYI